jgi:hypothetical protein
VPLRQEGGVHARIGVLLNSEHPHRTLMETARLIEIDGREAAALAA